MSTAFGGCTRNTGSIGAEFEPNWDVMAGLRPACRPSPTSLPSVPELPRAALRAGWSGRGYPNTAQLLGGGQKGNGARSPGPVGSICSSQDFAFVQSGNNA